MKIKIRAWDNDAQKMYYGAQELFDDMLGFRFEHFELDAEPVFMMSTGRKDEYKSTEIYADDVIEFYDNVMHEGTHAVVVWHKDNAAFYYKFIDGEYKGLYAPMNDDWRKHKIIGNIHENPELMEVDNES